MTASVDSGADGRANQTIRPTPSERPAAPAHIDEDLFVQLPKAKLVVAGDIAVTGYYPAVKPKRGGSYLGLRRALKAMLSAGAQTVVPGHGALGSSRTVAATLRFVTWAEAGVRAARQARLSRKQTISHLKKPAVKLEAMPRGLASLSKIVGELYDELTTLASAKARRRPGARQAGQ